MLNILHMSMYRRCFYFERYYKYYIYAMISHFIIINSNNLNLIIYLNFQPTTKKKQHIFLVKI